MSNGNPRKRGRRMRLVAVVGLTGLLAVVTLVLANNVLASGAGVAESIGLRDATDNVRARLGAQTDGSYGLRIWGDDGSMLYDLTPGGAGSYTPRVGSTIADLGTGMKDGEMGYL